MNARFHFFFSFFFISLCLSVLQVFQTISWISLTLWLILSTIFSTFFFHHLFLPQHFPSSGFEWALVVRIVCFLIFLSIIKSLLLFFFSFGLLLLLFKFLHRFNFYLIFFFACDSLLHLRYRSVFTVIFHIPLRFWFYFCVRLTLLQ